MRAYEQDLQAIGGLNPYGELVFVLTRLDRTILRSDGHREYIDCADQYATDWHLLEWLPAEDFGDPFAWPGERLGPYPARGRYVILQPFPNQRLGSRSLNPAVVRMIAFNAREHRRDSIVRRRQALANWRARESEARERRIADMLHDAYPQFTGPTSFPGSQTTRTAVQKKMEILEAMESRGELAKPRPRGFFAGKA